MYCCSAIADMTRFNLKLTGFQMLPFPVNQGWMTSKKQSRQKSVYLGDKVYLSRMEKEQLEVGVGGGAVEAVSFRECRGKKRAEDRASGDPNILRETTAPNRTRNR